MPDVSVGMLLLRLAVSLTVVVALMLIAARVLKRTGLGMGPSRPSKPRVIPIDVSAIKPVTRNASVAVVRVAGRELILGVTEQQVTLLRDAIEPRDVLGDLLPGDSGRQEPGGRAVTSDAQDAIETETGALDAATVHATDRPLPTSHGRLRTDRAAANRTSHRPRGDQAGLSAWTDALESLRERTVRR